MLVEGRRKWRGWMMERWVVTHTGCDKGTQGPLGGGKRLFGFAHLGCASRGWGCLPETQAYGTCPEKGLYCPGPEGRVRGS